MSDSVPDLTTPSRQALIGYLEVLGAATLWGSSGIFSVYLFRTGLPPESVALLRPLVGAVFLTALVAVRSPRALRPSGRALLYLAGLGGALTAVFQIAYQVAVDIVGVPTTVALLYLSPAMVVAIAGPLLGEWPSLRRVGLAVLSVAGVWMTVLGARGVDVEITTVGLLWGVLAAMAYGGYTLFGRHASPRHGSLATALHSTLGACLVLAVVVPAWQGGLVLPATSTAWGVLILFGLLTIAVAVLLFYDGLGRIEASRASITTTVEPVIAALLATWLLDQRLTGIGWVGLMLVVAGVAGAYATRGEQEVEAPEPTAH